MKNKNNLEKPEVVKLSKVLELLECKRWFFYKHYKQKLNSFTDPNHFKRQFYYLNEVMELKKQIEDNKPFTVVE